MDKQIFTKFNSIDTAIIFDGAFPAALILLLILLIDLLLIIDSGGVAWLW